MPMATGLYLISGIHGQLYTIVHITEFAHYQKIRTGHQIYKSDLQESEFHAKDEKSHSCEL